MPSQYLSCLAVLLTVISSFGVVYGSGEFDASTFVTSVTDGDTLETTSQGTVRLADVDAPEHDEEGYQAATDYLTDLIQGKSVYLDIDDLYTTGDYGRLICVLYLEYNSTHYLNVNKALQVEDHAKLQDYDNEFNPYTWKLYIPKQDIPQFPTWTPLLIILVSTIIVSILYRHLHSNTTKHKS
ncbi:MAG: thermonuclease family protein [Thermoproteota archaeon]